MIKLSGSTKKLIRVEHPNDHTVFVDVETLSRKEALEFFERVQESQEVVPLTVNGAVLRDKKNKPEYAVIQKYRVADVIDLLKRVVKTSGGFTNDDGEVKITKDNVELLFDQGLDVRDEKGEVIGGYWELVVAKATDQPDPFASKTSGSQ